ncbi:hypothetical protein PCH70_21340 [Pseudomonas cichorii JBC1]|nr:hypothetical protein PCH70_21340 [Pseudomonas cichorii JBC1]
MASQPENSFVGLPSVTCHLAVNDGIINSGFNIYPVESSCQRVMEFYEKSWK